MSKRYGLNIGVSGIGVYVPPLRVNLESWCEWTGASWPKTKAVVGKSFRMPETSESIYTMAATAVLRLILDNDIDPAQIGFLGFGTESSTDNAIGTPIIKGMVNQALRELGKPELARQCEVPEFKQACLGGIYALKAALRWTALDGRGRQAIVVSADTAEYARGSSGEPTQGAGAVAMWVEASPKLFEVDLLNAGSASDYRGVDFRKPFQRHFMDGYTESTQRLHDFPVFSGKYSTTCYIDEVIRAVEAMHEKIDMSTRDMYQSMAGVFMHRPYHRMPENALSALYVWGLGRSHTPEHQDELRAICEDGGASYEDVVTEMRSDPHLFGSVLDGESDPAVYKNAMGVARFFRSTDKFKSVVKNKMTMGSELMMDLGNLYTAALPAWLGAGIEEAFDCEIELAEKEFLLVGYGSGDAAESITVKMVTDWREHAHRIGMKKALLGFVDLTRAEYEALHDAHTDKGVDTSIGQRFVVDRVGQAQEADFQDVGVEYYRFVP